jgi:hypothetical protein
MQDQAAQTPMRAERDRGFAFATIFTSCPRATRKRIYLFTEKPSTCNAEGGDLRLIDCERRCHFSMGKSMPLNDSVDAGSEARQWGGC